MQEKNQIIDLNQFADGALAHKVNKELNKIIENINDPNTTAKKTRTLTIKITLTADEEREFIDTTFDVKSTLVGPAPGKAKMIMGKQNGQVTARELVSGKKGQIYMDMENGIVKTDTGVPVEEVEKQEEANVVKFKGATN